MPYDLKSFHLPHLGDRALHSVVSLLENAYSRRLLEPLVIKETGVNLLRDLRFCEAPTFFPLHPQCRAPSASTAKASLAVLQGLVEQPEKRPESPMPSTFDYAQAYRKGQLTPTQMADRLVAQIEASNQGKAPLHAIIATMDQDIRRQARESEQRLKAGKALSVLDGVPVAVKDELDAVPYTTTAGTIIYGQDGSAAQDATVVSRLRAAGAIIIGKANMHEIGIGITGANIHYGHCRNPYDLDRYSGGSSSGSAAAIAAGLCPLALGADGGGSIRVPAALCGVVGLKPTYSRVSKNGAFPLGWSVGHIGPMGATVDDVALGYATMAGPDVLDASSLQQPPVHLSDYLKSNLKGLKLGVFSPWFSHAVPEIVRHCQLAVEQLKALGATVTEIEIDELELQRVAHAIVISTEMLCSMQPEYDADASRFAGDSRFALSIGRCFSSTDYIRAQRMRTRAIQLYEQLFQKVDVIVTPSTGILAPPILAKNDDRCEASLTTLTDLMRFAFVGNLTGLPALTVPVTPSEEGLPVGLQLMGAPWQEHTLLRVGRALEQTIRRSAPKVRFAPI